MTRKKLCAALLSAALCVAALTGCGGNANNSAAPGTNAPGTNAPANTSAVSANAVTVSSVEQLLEAIAPGAEIVILPGYYNMSQYVNDLYAASGDEWNAQHPYVELQDCYDGAEVVIKNVKNLSISGGGDMSDTEVVIDPEHGTVFTFNSCSGVKLSNLTLGHTEKGVCFGNVMDLIACENIELRNMDLYGCGVIGLNCEGGTGDVFVYDSILHDCSDGPISIYGGAGKFEFRDCVLTDSASGGYFDGGGRAQVSFHNCSFGLWETDFWASIDGIETENCVWYEAPDYSDVEDGAYYGERDDVEFDGEDYGERDDAEFDGADYGENAG